MKIIPSQQQISRQNSTTIAMFEKHLESLHPTRFKPETNRKITELCQTQKFVEMLMPGTLIQSLSESPDFIINHCGQLVGLEHEVLLNPAIKQKEGFFQNLCLKLEERFYNENYPENFLAAIYFNENFVFKSKYKQKYLEDTYYRLLNIKDARLFEADEMISRIDIQPHSQISIYANFGAWFQDWIDSDKLMNAIKSKEAKYDSYIAKTGLKQWLLIVAATGFSSSLAIKNAFEFKYNSRFERIFVLEDGGGELYEL